MKPTDFYAEYVKSETGIEELAVGTYGSKMIRTRLFGRPCTVVGPAGPDVPCFIAFHGYTQTVVDVSWWFKDFPDMALFHESPACTGWRIVMPDGGNASWDRKDDERYVFKLFDYFAQYHHYLTVGGFSMGSVPASWCMDQRPQYVKKGIIHSGIEYPKNPQCPVMGVLAAHERCPFPISFVSFDGMMRKAYLDASHTLDTFEHAYRDESLKNHRDESKQFRVPGLIHRWWVDPGNSRFFPWMRNPTGHPGSILFRGRSDLGLAV